MFIKTAVYLGDYNGCVQNQESLIFQKVFIF